MFSTMVRSLLMITAVTALLLAAGCPQGGGTGEGGDGAQAKRPEAKVEKTKVVCTTGARCRENISATTK